MAVTRSAAELSHNAAHAIAGDRARVVAGLWNLLRGAVFVFDAAVYSLGYVLKPPLDGVALYAWMADVSLWGWAAVHLTLGALMLWGRRIKGLRGVCRLSCNVSAAVWTAVAGLYLAAAPADPAWTSAVAAASLSYLACARTPHP